MKKRYLILASILVTAQIFAAVPSFAEKSAKETTAEETIIEETAESEEDSNEDADADEEKVSRPEYDFHDYLKKLGDYKNLTTEVSPMEEVTDEMVEDEINRRMQDITDELTEGSVEEGDIANIDYVGKKDDVAFEGGTAEGADLKIGSHSFIEGFEEGLVGVKIGDTVDLNLTFPEQYQAEDLAGADVVFTVTVNSVRRVSEFSDDAASKLSDGACKDTDSYQAFIKEELINANKETQDAEAQNNFWTQILSDSEFEPLPEDVLAYDMEKQKEYDQNLLTLYYGMSLEDYCTSSGMTIEDYESMVLQNMENYLKYEILQRAILDAEGIKLTDEDFDAYVQDTAEKYGYELEDFLESQEASTIWMNLYYEKASEILLNSNTYTEKAAEEADADTDTDVEADAETDEEETK